MDPQPLFGPVAAAFEIDRLRSIQVADAFQVIASDVEDDDVAAGPTLVRLPLPGSVSRHQPQDGQSSLDCSSPRFHRGASARAAGLSPRLRRRAVTQKPAPGTAAGTRKMAEQNQNTPRFRVSSTGTSA